MFYLTTHSTHFIYSYMASDIWLRTFWFKRKETRCHHIGYSYRLTARALLYAPSHRQDNTYTAFVTPVVEHWLEREIAQWVRPWRIDPTTHRHIVKKGCGMCYPVCGMVHIKEPLLQIERVAYVVAAGFLSRYLSGPLPYTWHHITVNKMCWMRH